VSIKWTTKAKEGLQNLPQKVRRGILRKADELAECSDPSTVHKPLRGTLSGYRRLTFGRYRAVFEVKEDDICNGDMHWHVTIIFIAVGKRKERDKHDIYRIAEKIVEFQILDMDNIQIDESDG
jgi:mRNA-degrading endonuclease RelE of RelBE toxin-antitoxin system